MNYTQVRQLKWCVEEVERLAGEVERLTAELEDVRATYARKPGPKKRETIGPRISRAV